MSHLMLRQSREVKPIIRKHALNRAAHSLPAQRSTNKIGKKNCRSKSNSLCPQVERSQSHMHNTRRQNVFRIPQTNVWDNEEQQTDSILPAAIVSLDNE
ncbi:hypothetical protein ACJMK2_007077 [Sinanodonta woodiana]|uniref:Uncharacterized protein n=1 Tax=Sinanodonta woodiana TaxID=1069815 RepID=A0ABD3VHC7_SINWO